MVSHMITPVGLKQGYADLKKIRCLHKVRGSAAGDLSMGTKSDKYS